MEKQEFISKLRKHLHREEVTSVAENVPYTVEVSIGEGVVKGIRRSTGEPYKIDVNELLDAYNNGDRPLTTTGLKPFISGRVQSPALAILLKLEESLKNESV